MFIPSLFFPDFGLLLGLLVVCVSVFSLQFFFLLLLLLLFLFLFLLLLLLLLVAWVAVLPLAAVTFIFVFVIHFLNMVTVFPMKIQEVLRQSFPDALQSDPTLQRLPESIQAALEEDPATKRWLQNLLTILNYRWFDLLGSRPTGWILKGCEVSILCQKTQPSLSCWNKDVGHFF